MGLVLRERERRVLEISDNKKSSEGAKKRNAYYTHGEEKKGKTEGIRTNKSVE